MREYDHKKIENKWQKIWEKEGANYAEDNSDKPKYYCLIEFPYPSGSGLHVGHIRSNTAMDIIARKRRAEGYNVLYPIGWDAFGLPTENYAIKTKTAPEEVTKKNTNIFRRQLKSIGFSFDWSREINTTDPKYYKWTQWIFLQMFKHGLAYKKKTAINWCIDCKIGLANEEVVGGLCERCGGITEKREKEQWMLAITKYADRLYDDLDTVDYLEKIKIQQRNWIGRSEGAEIEFNLQPTIYNLQPIKVFTTRPDTLFGATYIVLAPEHEAIENLKLKIKNWDEVAQYIARSKKKTEIERTTEGKEKTGIELVGIKAINPANKEEIPIFIADYVLKDYGTGAIMAVPAHDTRDYEFAKKFNLPIHQVVAPPFYQSTEPGKFRPNEPEVVRDGIIAIIKHWSEDKYLGLAWKKVNWGTFLTGTIDRGVTPEETVLKEIKEETGYIHAKIIENLGVVDGLFYHIPKQENTHVHGNVFTVQLEDDTRKDISAEEDAKHEVRWLTKDELSTFLTADTHHYALDVFKNGQRPYIGPGSLINSGKFNDLSSEEAKQKITEFVGGQMKTTYKLRDWVFSRQRYWGEPIPLVFCKKDGWVAVTEEELPVLLPEVEAYTPTDTGESPLAKIDSWVNVKCPKCGGEAKRETDTMPNWAGSSWYYLRYIDPHNDKELASKEKLKYWMTASPVRGREGSQRVPASNGVDWYNGGMEHTTLHLLYSRFWHKFLFDIGAVGGGEPYKKRTSHGMVLAEKKEKMSKSKGNVINPDDIVEIYGADTLRLYEMFMGPFDQAVEWSTKNIIGPRRFLERVFKLKEKVKSDNIANKKFETSLNKTIKKVTRDIESMGFNTAISEFMILVNEMGKQESISKANFEIFLKLLAPFAPHITEELWQELGNEPSIHSETWPKHDESKLLVDEYTIVVQINGKVRGNFKVSASLGEEETKKKALESETTQKWLNGKRPKKVVYVAGKLVSIVF